MKASGKQKGQKGYLVYQRKKTAIRTAILFALCIGIYLTGYLSTGSNRNLLTIVAVLGCLPACRSAVNMIMVFRYQGIQEADALEIQKHTGSCQEWFDLVFTSYEKTFEVPHMAMKGNTLIGYGPSPKWESKACEKHLHSLFVQNSLGDVDITIFKELPKYKNRLDQLQGQADLLAEQVPGEENTPKPQVVGALLGAISL